MRLSLRILGIVLALLAAGALGHDLVQSAERGGFAFRALGAWWFALDPGSLNLAQAVIQRYTVPELWDPGIQSVLNLPAVMVFGGFALALLVLSRRRAAEAP